MSRSAPAGDAVGAPAVYLGPMFDRAHFEALDDADPLSNAVARFSLPDGVVYLDGNSLGPLAVHVPGVVQQVVEEEWGEDLIRSWNANGWWEKARVVGDRIASMIGAPNGTVVVGDTTTVSVYKAASAACRLRPGPPTILTDSGNFPTDLYALGSVADRFGKELRVLPPEEIVAAIGDDTSLVALTHVDYRTGRRHDMAEITATARAAGAIVVWDLAHSVGVMDLDLSEADMAVGCGYKYLNGGPGAPAFIYVAERHQDDFINPIAGWWGHHAPFEMSERFEPAGGIARAQIGTQPIISLAALEAALDVFEDVDMTLLREKSERLTSDFIALVDERLDGFEVVTPRDASARGSHVSLSHPEAESMMAALIADGVIGDVRPPNLLRFGFAPIYQRHTDVWDAVERLARVVSEGTWRGARVTGPVT